jgi:DNA (cytosine-5)-methyltransferase 1
MRKLTHGSLFSGIGGFDLAAEWMGWENKFHCEWNDFGQKVLHHYWPNAESFTDITKTDFTKYANKIDILTGGFPCQPYSSAGKRKGKEDERHLWPQMLRAIREVSPRFVVGENVRGLTNWNGGMVFEEVCAELESYGYQVAPVIIPACAVNAPHRRERVWFVAYAPSIRNDSTQSGGLRSEDATTDRKRTYPFYDGITPKSDKGVITNSDGSDKRDYSRANDRETEKVWRENEGNVSREFRGDGNVTDTTSIGFCEYSANQQLQSETYRTSNGMGEEITTDADGWRTQSQQNIRQTLSGEKRTNSDGSEWNVTNADSIGSAQRNGKNQRELPKAYRSKQFSSPANWESFPTKSPICSGDDGISIELDGITFPKWRAESIKAYGNAIVPQVAYQIFKAIEKTLYL